MPHKSKCEVCGRIDYLLAKPSKYSNIPSVTWICKICNKPLDVILYPVEMDRDKNETVKNFSRKERKCRTKQTTSR